MARTVVHTNYRVEVYPHNVNTFFARNETPSEIAQRDYRLVYDIREAILRHCDDLGGVLIESTLLTYCGTSPWTVDDEGDSLGRWPQCCDADQREFYVDHRIESDDWFRDVGLNNEDLLRELREDATLNQ